VALFNVRLDDDLAGRFDAWASGRGGRSASLRGLMTAACEGAVTNASVPPRCSRPEKLTVRLSGRDAAGMQAEAAKAGLTPNAWAAAVLRRRLSGRPTFPPAERAVLISLHGEVHRVGVNVNQIARALNTAVIEGRILDLELGYLDDLRRELRGHMGAMREAFEGNLAYWDGAP